MPIDQPPGHSGLKPLSDLALGISITVTLLHCYYCAYPAFAQWQLTLAVTDRLIGNFFKPPWTREPFIIKSVALVALVFAQLGARPVGVKKLSTLKIGGITCTGLFLYYFCYLVVASPDVPLSRYSWYIAATLGGWAPVFWGLSRLAKSIAAIFYSSRDVFNSRNESFPQEERLVKNEFSINLPAVYSFRGVQKNSWINIINPFRGLLVMGTPGSGKSYFIIRHIIRQHIQKGFSMFIYDFKFPELTD